jgi:hypothetical protein
MIRNAIKSFFAITMLFTTGIRADEKSDSSNNCSCTCIEKYLEEEAEDYSSEVSWNECGWYSQVDLLIWKTCQNGLAYAGTSSNYTGNGYIARDASTRELEYDWDLGFRLATGYRTVDQWNTDLSYTYFKSKASDSITEPAGGVVFAFLQFPGAANETADFASAKLTTEYHVFDAAAGFPLSLFSNYELNPFIGFRFMKLDQDLDVNYVGDDFAASGDGVDWKSDLYSCGIRGGIAINYQTPCGLSFNGKFGGSTLVAYIDGTLVQIDDGNVRVDLKEQEHCEMIFGIEALLGLNYERCMCDKMLRFSLNYEIQQWLNIPRKRVFFDDAESSSLSVSGSLGFHGLSVNMEVPF